MIQCLNNENTLLAELILAPLLINSLAQLVPFELRQARWSGVSDPFEATISTEARFAISISAISSRPDLAATCKGV